MRKLFFKGVVKHRKAVIVLFVVAAVVCAFLQPLVGVNYDLNDYLPDGVASTEAIDVMDEEFDGGIPNMRVMVRDVGIEEALACKDAISAVDGVEDVMWLDDAVDIREPIEMQDADTVETYYRDGAALFSVTVEEGREVEAVDGIRAVVGDGAALDGAAVSTAVATTGTVDEINLVTAVAIVVIMLVLFLTTQSWLEPFLVMAGLGSRCSSTRAATSCSARSRSSPTRRAPSCRSPSRLTSRCSSSTATTNAGARPPAWAPTS